MDKNFDRKNKRKYIKKLRIINFALVIVSPRSM